MRLVIDVPEEAYNNYKEYVKRHVACLSETVIANGIPYEERPQGELTDEVWKLTDEVWKLYKKHQSHLATYVLEFGEELADLLGKYNEGGKEE